MNFYDSHPRLIWSLLLLAYAIAYLIIAVGAISGWSLP
jgi:hypothetical protein